MVALVFSVGSPLVSIIYGGFSFVGFLLGFGDPLAYSGLVSPPNTIAIASLSLSVSLKIKNLKNFKKLK